MRRRQHNSHHWELLDTGAAFQPTRFFGGLSDKQATHVKPPDGYEHWLQIVSFHNGHYEMNVFYPLDPADGERISVLIDINWYDNRLNNSPSELIVIEWWHSMPGLFNKAIMPLLL